MSSIPTVRSVSGSRSPPEVTLAERRAPVVAVGSARLPLIHITPPTPPSATSRLSLPLPLDINRVCPCTYITVRGVIGRRIEDNRPYGERAKNWWEFECSGDVAEMFGDEEDKMNGDGEEDYDDCDLDCIGIAAPSTSGKSMRESFTRVAPTSAAVCPASVLAPVSRVVSAPLSISTPPSVSTLFLRRSERAASATATKLIAEQAAQGRRKAKTRP